MRMLMLFVVASCLQMSFFQSTSLAARACRVVVADTPSVALNRLKGDIKLNVKGETLAKVKQLFGEAGIELYTKNIVEALEGASEVLREGSNQPSVEKSDKLAELGDKLITIVKNDFTKAQNLQIGYHVAEAVLKMERIELSKYGSTPSQIFNKDGALHVKDFHKYVESYIDGSSLYANLGSEVGFISWPDIRHLYSNNSWGIGLRDHDMYHLHYAYGHPYYLAVNFQASRSINDRRYMMISSFWESIDSNQTGYESKMAGYFKHRRMSPQEGMIFLGRATKAMLEEIDRFGYGTAESSGYFQQVSYTAGSWKPQATKFGRTSFATNHEVYDKELQDFINKSIDLLADPTNKKYYNYHRKGPGKTSARDEDACVI